MKKLLLSGFAPFLGETLNPSQMLVESVTKDPRWSSAIDAVVLPVAFERAADVLRAHWNPARHGAVLMFGQAGRSKISLERVALNWMETKHPDEDGFLPPLGSIRADEPPALISPLPLESWRDQLEARGVPAEVSFSAGGYVCNRLYFDVRSLWDAPSLFVHVPFIPEQGKPGDVTLGFETMKRAAEFLVERMLEVGL